MGPTDRLIVLGERPQSARYAPNFVSPSHRIDVARRGALLELSLHLVSDAVEGLDIALRVAQDSDPSGNRLDIRRLQIGRHLAMRGGNCCSYYSASPKNMVNPIAEWVLGLRVPNVLTRTTGGESGLEPIWNLFGSQVCF